jgi:hypothetical protein
MFKFVFQEFVRLHDGGSHLAVILPLSQFAEASVS